MGRWQRILRAGLLAAALAATSPLRALDEAQPRQDPEAVGVFATQVVMFVFLHELGHALVDLLELPVVGRQEDAVDQFAALLLLETARELEAGGEAEQAALVWQSVVHTALAWKLMWQAMERRIARGEAEIPWWGEHSLQIQRYYNILCTLYGSNPERFADLARRAGLPEQRAARCRREFELHDRSWRTLVEPFERPEGEEPAPSDGRFEVVYGEGASELQRQLIALFREAGVWDEIARSLNRNIRLPEGRYPIRFESCGTANAFWNFVEDEMTICLELYEYMAELYIEETRSEPPPAGGAAPEAGPGRLGPLVVPAGRNPPWTIAYEGSALVIVNADAPDNFYQVWLPDSPAAPRRAWLELSMEVAAGRVAAAGLLVARREGEDFQLVLVGDGQRVLLMRTAFDARGRPQSELLQSWSVGVDPRARHRLEVREQSGRAFVYLDGRLLGEALHPRFGAGEVGLYVFGVGRFRFEGFGVEPLQAPETQEPPAPQPPMAAPAPPPPPVAAPAPTTPLPDQPPPPIAAPAPPAQTPPPIAAPAPAPPAQAPPPVAVPPVEDPQDATGMAGIRAIFRVYRQVGEQMTNLGQPPPLPPPPPGWKQHIDPTVAALVVNYPPGWQVSSVARSVSFGRPDYAEVSVLSPDGRHAVLANRTLIYRPVHPAQVVEELLGIYVRQLGPLELLEQDEFVIRPRGSLQAVRVLLRAAVGGGYVVVAVAATSTFTYGPTALSQVGSVLIIGPQASFSAMTREVYLQILNSIVSW